MYHNIQYVQFYILCNRGLWLSTKGVEDPCSKLFKHIQQRDAAFAIKYKKIRKHVGHESGLARTVATNSQTRLQQYNYSNCLSNKSEARHERIQGTSLIILSGDQIST